MFLDILNMIFDCFKSVIDAIDVPILEYEHMSFTFWELILGVFVVSVIFAFFLRQRAGSAFGAVQNLNKNERSNRDSSKGGK